MDPRRFFGPDETTHSGCTGLIEFCSNDVEQIEDTDPTRRKINLTLISENIEREVNNERRHLKRNHEATIESQKPETITSRVLTRLGGQRREKLGMQYNVGRKWACIKPRWMQLALKKAAITRFVMSKKPKLFLVC